MNLPYTEYPDSVRLVNEFDALLTTNFSQEQNAIAYPRTVNGQFGEVATHIMDVYQARHPNITQVSTAMTTSAKIHGTSWEEIKGLFADQDDKADTIALLDQDIEEFQWHGLSIDLRIERGHTGKANEPHYDGSGTKPLARLLTCYTLPDTKGWAKDDVEISRSDLSLTFADSCVPFGMGVGPIWRMAIMGDMIEDDIDPFIHMRESSEEARMILVATKN